MAIILANLCVFALQLLLALEGRLEPFILEFAFIASEVGQEPIGITIRSIFTSMFLHGGLLHLLFNVWFLFVFGPPVEYRLGTLRTALVYAGAGVGAAATQYAVTPLAGVPMIGASGAIAGILGAYLIISPFALVVTLVPWFIPLVPIPAFLFIFLWFAFQFIHGVDQLAGSDLVVNIAWWAHIGGFLSGLLLVAIVGTKRSK